MYPLIEASLDRYITDLEAEGTTVYVGTVSGGSPQEIKDWVTDRYDAGSQGFVFIGDITAAWADVLGSQFPCDLFYMDLDGSWKDDNLDGVYESHTAGSGDMAPEVYVGRLCAHTLSYDTESNLINGYFDKANALPSVRTDRAVARTGVCRGGLVEYGRRPRPRLWGQRHTS